MPDIEDVVAAPGVADRFEVDLGDQRAGRVDHLEAALVGEVAVRGRDAVRREDQRAAGRHLVQALHEDGATVAQVGHDLVVVDDLVLDVDRRSVDLEHALDDLDRSGDSRAEPARPGEQHLHGSEYTNGVLGVGGDAWYSPGMSRQPRHVVACLLAFLVLLVPSSGWAQEPTPNPLLPPAPPAEPAVSAAAGPHRRGLGGRGRARRPEPPERLAGHQRRGRHEPAVSMLDTLKEKGLRTSFFVLGWWAEREPAGAS